MLMATANPQATVQFKCYSYDPWPMLVVGCLPELGNWDPPMGTSHGTRGGGQRLPGMEGPHQIPRRQTIRVQVRGEYGMGAVLGIRQEHNVPAG